MDTFIARRNIDHYLTMLDDPALLDVQRNMVRRLLVEEENKLGRDQEQLDFVQRRLVTCQRRMADLQHLRDSVPPGSPEWEKAAEVLQTSKVTLDLLWKSCQQLRLQIELSPL